MSRHIFAPADLPKVIPIFPLPGALLLPRGLLPLHIFGPRYLAMIEDCMKTPERLVGMISTRAVPAGGGEDDAPLAAIGCAGRLTRFHETDDGRYLITLSGVSRFRIKAEVEGFTPYRRAEMDWADFSRDLGAAEDDPGFDREGFIDLLDRFLTARNLAADHGPLTDAPPERLINAISSLLPLAHEEKQALLEAPDLTARRRALVTLMEFTLLGGDGEDLLQ